MGKNGEIIACILPDGENIYTSIKAGFEQLYPELLSYSEEHCLPLFGKADDGSVKFWVAANDSLTYMQETLLDMGYARYAEEDYDNYVNPLETSVSVDLPKGFALLYGAILRCKEKGIEKCYVNSFGWRKKFYNAAGFLTEDSTGFWYKTIRC